MCARAQICVSLLRAKHRDHIVPLRVNIPSQVSLISLERKGGGEEREINIKDKRAESEGKKNGGKGNKSRCQE